MRTIKVIPMYTPTTLQAPRGHMTRPQTYAIGHKVNSLLSESSLSTCQTWLLPKSEVFCMIRYQEGPPEDAHEDVQVPKSTDEENQRKEPRASPRPRTSGQGPGHPAPGASSTTAAQPPEATGPGHPASTARTSGLSRAPGHPATSPEILPLRNREQQMPPLQPRHPATSPDIRRCLKAQTSGPTIPDIRPPLSVHSEGPRLVYPFSP